MSYNEFVQQAVLAQMQGHPVLGVTYMESECEKLIKNAIKLANALVKEGCLNG